MTSLKRRLPLRLPSGDHSTASARPASRGGRQGLLAHSPRSAASAAQASQ